VEGRITLASQYETMLQDRDSALGLLREAERIAPDSEALTRGFQARNFRKVNGQWVGASDSNDRKKDQDSDDDRRTRKGSDDSLMGATRDDLRARLGKPDRVVRTATKGKYVEQWIYINQKGNQYYDFVLEPGPLLPVVRPPLSRP